MTPRSQRSVSALAVACLVLPGALLVGCGSGGGSASSSAPMASAPPIDASGGGAMRQTPMQSTPQPPKAGMSGKTKVALLVGAAALYYMYKKNQQKHAQSPKTEPQYFLSKNGRVYYRQPNGQAVWVTPPPQGIQVPMQEAQEYSGYQGYNNAPTGRTLEDLVRSGGYAQDPQGAYSGQGGRY